MPEIIRLAVISCLLNLVLGNPLDQISAGKVTFSIEQTAIERPRGWTGVHAIRETYIKYGIKVPEEIENEIAQDAPPRGGSALAVPGRNDISYTVKALVGKHNLSLDLDTGSSDLWVASTLLPESTSSRGARQLSRLYDPKGSGATAMDGGTWRITYGDRSSAGGPVFFDKVTIGGLTVPKQAVQAASSMSPAFVRDGSRDGMLGLGFRFGNTVRPQQQNTWFDNIRPQLSQPLFTCTLKRHAAGTYDFGFIDPKKYTGEIVYHSVGGKRAHWDFNATGFAIGKDPVQPFNIYAIADTGSSLWYMPKGVVDTYWGKVQGASFNQGRGGWFFPCATQLPDLTVIISGKPITVPGINFNYATGGGGNCMGGLQRDLPLGFSIFGDVFLKGLMVVFEYAGKPGVPPRLGFAHAHK